MWHEARKQEKKIKGILVDYKKRAERRKEYYERIKLDPTQFIQIHGRSCKVHLDPSVYYAAEAPGSMLPWRGDPNILIDRFDVRAHLDAVPPLESTASPQLGRDERKEMRRINYERYRILVQNEFMGIKEERFLHQIHLEELYGPIVKPDEERKPTAKKAAIGFVYDEDRENKTVPLPPEPPPNDDENAESDEDSDEEIDLDLTVDVMALGPEHQAELNSCGLDYALGEHDFMSMIKRDLREAEAIRLAKEQEDEKAMYSGRKSRKERRLIKKKHLGRKGSPRMYASRSSPTLESLCSSPHSNSSSRSPSPSKSAASPQNSPQRQATFITSMGDESDVSDAEHGVIIMPKTASSSKSSQSKTQGSNSATKSYKKNRWERTSPSRSSTSRRRFSSGSSGGRSVL